jgi:hypothetical protein
MKLSAVGSNVRVNVGSVTPTGATISGCTPANALTTTFDLDPTAASSDPASITCDIVSQQLTQTHYEDGSLTWSIKAGTIVAKGGNTTINQDYTVSYTKVLTQTRQYRLGIKRIPFNATDFGTDPVVWAGKQQPH